jgi:Na+-driven multidrug efflux pump
MIIIGVNQGMQPIAGFNFGARRFDRVGEVFQRAVAIASGVATLGFLLGELFPHAVAGLFTRDPRLIAQAVRGLRLTFIVYPFVGYQMVTSSFFQSIGRAKISLFIAFSRQVILLIPFLVLLPVYFGLDGVWVAEPAADLIAFLVAFLLMRSLGGRLDQQPG